MHDSDIRHDWQRAEIAELCARPFNDLLYQAHGVHRTHHDASAMQISTLLSIKTGACPEDCSYCPQSAHYNTQIERERLLPLDEVIAAASAAKRAGVCLMSSV